MMDVVFYEVFKEEEAALRKILPKNIHAVFYSQTIQGISSVANPQASLISIRTQSKIPLSWASQLKGILTRSQGFDHLIAFRQACKKDIPCGYLGNYCSRAAAEHAILVMMALLRKLKSQLKNFETFNRDQLTGSECKNKCALVVGVGNIGSEIVEVSKALGMRAKGVDLVKRHKGLTYVSLEKGIKWAHVIFCAMPLNQGTKDMLNYEVLKKAQEGFIFINISRGEISPLEDLRQLLEDGRMGGLGLDVFPEEAMIAEDLRSRGKIRRKNAQIILGLKDKENVIFTPHNAFNTSQALEQKAKLTAEALRAFWQRGKFPQPAT